MSRLDGFRKRLRFRSSEGIRKAVQIYERNFILKANYVSEVNEFRNKDG